MKTYNVSEAAALCKCHPDTIRNLIHDGRLRASKLGRGYCIRAEELDALLTESENARVQASLANRSEEKCLDKKTTESSNGTESGTSTSCLQAAKELDALLEQRKGRKPAN